MVLTTNNASHFKEIAVYRFKEHIECLKEETKQKINEELHRFANEVMDEVIRNDPIEKQLTNVFNNNYVAADKAKTTSDGLPEKVFVTRNSLLTDLFQIKHIGTIRHIFIAMLAGQFIQAAVNDYFQSGQLAVGLDKIIIGFSKLHIAAVAWIFMFSTSLINYVAFRYWATVRTNITPKSLWLKIWDRTWICLLVLYYYYFICYFTNVVNENDLPPPTASVILAEEVRFIMKTYAFIRSNVPRVLHYKPHTEDKVLYPKFSKYVYFLFVPTLIYRDEYPRTKHIRWRFVGMYIIEFIATIFYCCFVIEHFFLEIYQNYGKGRINWNETALHILGNYPAGAIFMLCGFYILLHAWLNVFAELLRFGDRMFYKDWWNSDSYGSYYRKWNVVVHDWLYTYVYKDMYENVFKRNKVAARLMVFFISALVHEYIVSLMFGFFFPFLFVEFFVIGGAMVFLNFNDSFFGNIFFWYTISVGMSLTISMYCIEFFVRQNCPKEDSTVIDFFIPRIFTCDRLWK